MREVRIEFVNHGLANIINDRLYVNKLLLLRPDLYRKVLRHEERHIRGESSVDWNEKWDKELFKFILKHPSTWVQFLPVWIVGRRIVYSKTWMGVWLVLLSCVGMVGVTAWTVLVGS